MVYGLLGGLAVILCSILGSVIGLLFPRISHRTNDMFLGFAAGVMLTAAFVGLLPEAFVNHDIISVVVATCGVFVGAFCLSEIDRFVPHAHFHYNEFQDDSAQQRKTSRVLLIVVAIAIHNIPEGLATGISLSGGLTSNGLTVAASMMLQKIPEGLIVVLPLLSVGMSKQRAFYISILVALMMLPGVLIGIFFGSLPPMLHSFFTAFTFGAIVYVVSHEIIPESHEHGFQKPVTFALIVGILSVVVMQMIF